jgi:hypothetical protein
VVVDDLRTPVSGFESGKMLERTLVLLPLLVLLLATVVGVVVLLGVNSMISPFNDFTQ